MHRYIPVLAKNAGFGNIGEKVVIHQARKYGESKFGINRFIPVSSLYDPLIVGLRAGVIGRVNLGNVTALVFDPSIYVGFTHRQRFNNTQSLDLPFWFYFQATDVVVPFVGSAVSGPFDGFFDDFAMPLEGGILFDVARDVDIGFSVRFHRLVGSGGDADARGLYFLGRFRF